MLKNDNKKKDSSLLQSLVIHKILQIIFLTFI